MLRKLLPGLVVAPGAVDDGNSSWWCLTERNHKLTEVLKLGREISKKGYLQLQKSSKPSSIHIILYQASVSLVNVRIAIGESLVPNQLIGKSVKLNRPCKHSIRHFPSVT